MFRKRGRSIRNNKIKSLIGFDEECVSSIKSLAIKKETKVNLTTRFLNGKILMFSKTSTQRFVYDLIDVFMSPDKDVKKIKDVKIIYSTSVFFIFVCKLSCSIDEEKASDVIFDV